MKLAIQRPMKTKTNTLLVTTAILLAFLAAPLARAAEESPEGPGSNGGSGISVAGTGEVKGKPTVVEIGANVAGEAELAADAIVKYRDARRRAVEALNGLKLAGLKVDSGGFAVNQGVDSAQAQAIMQGNAAPGGKQRVTVSEQLKLTLTGADKMKDEELMDIVLKILDTGRDAGLQIGRPGPRNYYEMQMFYNNGGGQQGSLVAFKLVEPDAMREQAYKAAMDDAKKKASRLANLAGVKLGRIVSVKDAVAINGANSQNAAMMAMYGVIAPQEANELSSGVFKEISVKVNLAVQFEIAK
jgi:uncharacterized protein YggE